MKIITSPQNALIKNIVELTEKARERRQQGVFVAEGLREVRLALEAGYEVQTLLYDPALTSDTAFIKEAWTPQTWAAMRGEVIHVNAAVMEKIAYRAGVPNVVALITAKDLSLAQFKSPTKQPLYLVLETVEKPGNLGAMLRTADAAGVTAVIVCDAQTDIYNPNVVRASLGALFTVPVLVASSADSLAWLKQHNTSVFVTYLEASKLYHTCDFKTPTAIVMGSEARGVSNQWLGSDTQRIIIPQQGKVDSLNVSNAAAVVLFEALRQRAV